jgi:hypothetical protein
MICFGESFRPARMTCDGLGVFSPKKRLVRWPVYVYAHRLFALAWRMAPGLLNEA